MQKITLEINSRIYDYVMFFLENIPKNLLSIKKEMEVKTQHSNKQLSSSLDKKLPDGFLNPIEIDSYKNIASRDELYER